MRLLTDREDGVSPYVSEDFQEQYEASVLKPICKAQAKLTRKEVGDEMMKMSTLQEFHALRVRLIQGKLEEK